MVLDKQALPMAYKEVITIIEHLPDELYIKIPDEIIQNLMLMLLMLSITEEIMEEITIQRCLTIKI